MVCLDLFDSLHSNMWMVSRIAVPTNHGLTAQASRVTIVADLQGVPRAEVCQKGVQAGTFK